MKIYIRRGEEQPQSVLTDELVREIRMFYSDHPDEPYRVWAKRLGVTTVCIGKVVRWQAWTHVESVDTAPE